MASSLDDHGSRAALTAIARDFHARGWMLGTAGNLSARADAEHFWITASGVPKGRLDEDDFLLVRIADGEVVEKAAAHNKPSAETAIHGVLYRLFPEARAVLHGHSVAACAAGARARPGARGLRLPPLEMIKAFDLWAQRPKAELALFENHLEVERIARAIGARFARSRPALSALLVRAHGATVWGKDLEQAYNRFEALEFIFSYMARLPLRL